MTTTSRATLLREVARRLYRQSYKEWTGQATGSTVSVVTAVELLDAASSDVQYDGAWLYIYEGTGIGSARRVSRVDPLLVTTHGSATLTRPLAAACDTTSRGFLYAGPLSPDDLIRCLNDALRRMRRQRLIPHSILPDYLMEESGTTNWTVSNGGAATLSKTTSATLAYEGEQALTFSGGTIGATTHVHVAQGWPATPGERVNLEVTLVGSTDHEARAAIIHGNTGAEIASVTGSGGGGPFRLAVSARVPSDASVVAARVYAGQSVSAPAAYVLPSSIDEMLFWFPQRTLYPFSLEIDRFDQVVAAYQRLPRGVVTPEGDGEVRDFYATELRRLNGWRLRPDPNAVHRFAVDVSQAEGYSQAYPLVLEVLLPWPELTSDADTTQANPDEVVLRARALAYELMASGGNKEENEEYERQAAKLRASVINRAAYSPRPPMPVGRRRYL